MPQVLRNSSNRAPLAALAAVALMIAGCGGAAVPPGTVVNVDKHNFRSVVLKNNRPVLVEFWSYNCEPCKELAPRLAALAQEHEDLLVAKVNSDENEAIAQEYGVRFVPTLFVFEDGEIIRRHTGAPTPQELAELIAPHLGPKK